MIPPLSRLTVTPTHMQAGGESFPCVIGRAGFSAHKHEGDGATPIGRFALRECFYRPDRKPKPQTALPVTSLTPDMGWCDDPMHPAYNTRIMLPFTASHETLWRDDHCYDLLVVIGYNDTPPVSGKGSAIFLHLLHDDSRPTAGCVALAISDMRRLLPRLSPETMIELG